MPRAARAAKLKAGVNIPAAPGSAETDKADEHADEIEGEADEPPAKRAKGKGKATGNNSTKRTTWEPIRKPPLCKEWKDIPDWKGREDSPLMGLPSTLLDKIFCVRPELGVSLHSRQEGGIYANNQVPRLYSFGWSMQIVPTSHDRRLLEGVFTS